MRVLLTNTTLAHRTGSELYVAEVARALLCRGLRPAVWSPVLGELAAELRAAGVEVADDLARVEPPDLIHGQHHLETMTALLHFPSAPCVFVCHGWTPWEEAPLRFPRIRRYVAVDQPTRERLTGAGVPDERIATVLNFVDLARFRERPPESPLPPRPRRALAFGNNASEATCLPALRAACARAGIALEAAGLGAGNPIARPDAILPAYDLVFAKGRAALEAMAVGAAVILCDDGACGPLVSSGDFDRLRPLNFGLRTLTAPLTPETVAREIGRYDAADAARVSARVRREAGLDDAVERLLAVYREALTEAVDGSAAGDEEKSAEESRAAARYLRWLNPFFKERGRLLIDRAELWRRVEALEGEGARQRAAAEAAAQAAEAAAAAEAAGLRGELAAVRRTATWRLRERLTGRPALVRIYRSLRRLGPPAG